MTEIASENKPSEIVEQALTVRALLVGDRLNPFGLESRVLISTTPAAFRIHASRMGLEITPSLLDRADEVVE